MIEANIEHIVVGTRFRKDFGDIAKLAESIEDLGLLQPIGIDSGYRLVFGERRLRAFKHLGRKTIPVLFVNLDSIIRGEYAENEMRESFKVSERVAIGLALEAEVGERRGRPTIENVQVLAQLEGQKTRDIAADKAGFGNPETYRLAKKVVDSAPSEIVGAMDSGEVSINLASQFTDLPAETQQEAIAAIADGDESAKEVMRDAIRNHRAIGTGENEWYTPGEYVAMAREVMGSIDLDPASCEEANKVVDATVFYTKEDDGLSKEWAGNLWVNPPYSRDLMPAFIEKLKVSYIDGDVESAILLSHNNTDTQWFHNIAAVSSAICFPKKRIKFYRDEEIAAPTNGQTFFYLGDDVGKFAEVFGEIGIVVEPV